MVGVALDPKYSSPDAAEADETSCSAFRLCKRLSATDGVRNVGAVPTDPDWRTGVVVRGTERCEDTLLLKLCLRGTVVPPSTSLV